MVAIVLTIMVLELHSAEPRYRAVLAVLPLFGAYVLVVRQRRHLLEQPPPHDAGGAKVDGRVLWANLGLLFWLTLVPL